MRRNISLDSHLGGLRTLIVDDEDSCNFLTVALELYGIQGYAVSSARQALRVFIRHKPDVLISGLAMPKIDGYSLIRKLRQLEIQKLNLTSAIAVTALPENSYKLLSNEFQGFLQKPVDIDELVIQITDLVKPTQLAV